MGSNFNHAITFGQIPFGKVRIPLSSPAMAWIVSLLEDCFGECGVSLHYNWGGARGVMVIVAGYGHGDTSSNPGPDWLHFT